MRHEVICEIVETGGGCRVIKGDYVLQFSRELQRRIDKLFIASGAEKIAFI